MHTIAAEQNKVPLPVLDSSKIGLLLPNDVYALVQPFYEVDFAKAAGAAYQ